MLVQWSGLEPSIEWRRTLREAGVVLAGGVDDAPHRAHTVRPHGAARRARVRVDRAVGVGVARGR